ncbi:hypothetical protein ES703_108786 [subsurface metagenome]
MASWLAERAAKREGAEPGLRFIGETEEEEESDEVLERLF